MAYTKDSSIPSSLKEASDYSSITSKIDSASDLTSKAMDSVEKIIANTGSTSAGNFTQTPNSESAMAADNGLTAEDAKQEQLAAQAITPKNLVDVGDGMPSKSSEFNPVDKSEGAMSGNSDLTADAAKQEQLAAQAIKPENLVDVGDGMPSKSSEFNPVGNSKEVVSSSNVETSEDLRQELLAQRKLEDLNNQKVESFDSTAYENLKKKNIKVDLKEVRILHNRVCAAADYFNTDVIVGINNIINSFADLNKKTYEKLKYDLGVLEETLQKTYVSNITAGFNDLIANLTQNLKDNDAINSDSGGSSNPENPEDISTKPPGGGGGGGEGDTDPKPIDDITPETPINQDNLKKLTPAIAGMVTFTEVVSMYTSIGAENPVQSSLTGNYGLLGLVHQNDKYYYKIIDKDTGQVYFVEMNDKAKITWDDRGERQAIEVVGDNAFVMKLPQEGEVLVRTADIGDVYFLNGDKMTFDGIDYYNITDNITGETAYIPAGEAISGPTLVSNLGSTPASNSSSEVVE